MEPPATISANDFLAHVAWVRALARALTADPGTADDLAQDTWIAAMRSPPVANRSPRPWLARVMRNLSRSQHRQESRRVLRERLAARQEAPHAADEIAAEIELHQALAGALARLAEPTRSTIVRRYFHGWSSADIARDEGVPESTVRNRLKRGLDALRDDLDKVYGGSSTWIALLQPLVSPASPPSGGAESHIPNALPMSGSHTLVKVLLALTASTAAVLWWREEVRTESSPMSASVAQADRAPGISPAETVLDSPQGPVESRTLLGTEPIVGGGEASPPPAPMGAPTRATQAELAVTLVARETQRPMSDIELLLLPAQIPNGWSSTPVQGSVGNLKKNPRTDKDGRASFFVPPDAAYKLSCQGSLDPGQEHGAAVLEIPALAAR